MHVWGKYKHIGCWWGNQRERDNLEYLFVDNRVILKRIFKKYDGGREGGGLVWIDVAQDRDRWCAAVNMVRNLWAP